MSGPWRGTMEGWLTLTHACAGRRNASAAHDAREDSVLLPWATVAGVDVFASTSLAVEQLYNLHHDPLTQTNLVDACPRERGCMRALYRRLLDAHSDRPLSGHRWRKYEGWRAAATEFGPVAVNRSAGWAADEAARLGCDGPWVGRGWCVVVPGGGAAQV